MQNCQCNNSVSKIACNKCMPCNKYCTPCLPINSDVTEYFSEKFSRLESNYPIEKCSCNQFGTNPRYYTPEYIPCSCKDKCYPC